jgi:ABC-type nitrate/sulfonate/bicarbonate transport system ATPase subunit
MPAAADIVVEAVSKVFSEGANRLAVLDQISFRVERGAFVCIVGPSGCGKTTLLRILLGLEKPTSGQVIVDQTQVHAGVAYVQQAPSLLPWRTLLQNAALGYELKGTISGARIEFVQGLINRYGLGGFEQSLPHQLSGGMSQRVAVIRALASRPRLLFCDEPFSSIDFVTRLDLNTKFKYMCNVEGITTVFVTHNIEEALFLGDTVIVMSGRPGRIVNTYRPTLSVGREDAVKCRQAPEFAQLFSKIWEDLERHRAGRD